MRSVKNITLFVVTMLFPLAILIALPTAPAQAQATRTWISGVGDDANPCSRTAPCKTFAGAIAKTSAGGEIDCLDPGGFGALTITKAITLDCRYTSNGGVLVSGTNGIVVAAGATDIVSLIGLDFDGATNTGLNGVSVTSGLIVYINDCLIRNFSQNGVSVTSSTAGARVVIKNSFINNNGTGGSTFGGVYVAGNGVANSAAILNTVVDGNANFAASVASGNSVGLYYSVLSGSPAGLAIASGGNAVSYGPSNVITGTGTPNITNPFK
jgi:hypothetical protein